jgi:broad specificity phosphatase PhoE
MAVSTGAKPPPFPPGPTTVVLIRHADVVQPPLTGDDPLTPAGQARAVALCDLLQDAGVGAIYTSDRLRTKQTAAPLAARRGLTPVVWTGTSAGLAADLLAHHRGSTVLVVGHSNTVPEIAAALGRTWPGVIGPTSFDNLLWMSIPTRGRKSLHHLHYRS